MSKLAQSIFLFSTLLQFSKVHCSSVAATQFNHTLSHGSHEDLSCFSCTYIEKLSELTAEGCGKSRPPKHLQTKDCFAFSSPAASAAVRHNLGIDSGSYNPSAGNVHCVVIKGRSDIGGKAVLRGCLILPEGEEYVGKTCESKGDFPLMGAGLVKDVEYCYCKGHGCNGAEQNSVALSALLLLIFAKLSLT